MEECTRLASDHQTGSVQLGVGESQGGNNSIASPFARTEIDEQHLIFVKVDQVANDFLALSEIGGGELALEDGILKVVSEVAHGFKDLTETFVIADVIRNDVSISHVEAPESKACVRELRPLPPSLATAHESP